MARAPVLTAAATAMLAWACAQGEAPPRAASSADNVAYARHYPKDVARASERFEQEDQQAREGIDAFANYLDALSDPDWTLVAKIYEAADEEGRGRAYAQSREQERTVRTFYEDERKKLVGRVAGATQHAAKEKGYDVQLYGPTDWALERGVDERLEDRRRASSDAHALVEANAKSLGTRNEKALTQQVDEIVLASYVAHVGAAQDEYELRELVAEASDARAALELRRDELKAQDKAPAEEVRQVDEALAELTPAVDKAEGLLKDAEQRRLDLQAKYDDAMTALRNAVSDRARQAEDQRAADGAAK